MNRTFFYFTNKKYIVGASKILSQKKGDSAWFYVIVTIMININELFMGYKCFKTMPIR